MGIVQEIKIWPYEQVVYAQPGICPGEWDVQNYLDFEIQRDPLISTRPSDSQQKKENLPNSELCSPGEPQSKNKRSEKRVSAYTLPEN